MRASKSGDFEERELKFVKGTIHDLRSVTIIRNRLPQSLRLFNPLLHRNDGFLLVLTSQVQYSVKKVKDELPALRSLPTSQHFISPSDPRLRRVPT